MPSKFFHGAVILALAATTVVAMPSVAQADPNPEFWSAFPSGQSDGSFSAPVAVSVGDIIAAGWIDSGTKVQIAAMDHLDMKTFNIPDGQNATGVQLAVDANGTIAGTWVQTDGSNSEILFSVSVSADQRTWSTPFGLSDGVTGVVSNPSVAIDGAGTIAVVWNQTVSGVTSIMESFLTDSWSTPVMISDPQANTPNYSQPVVTALTTGFMATWRKDGANAGTSLFQSREASTAGVLQSETDLSDFGFFANDLPVASTIDGTVTLLSAEFVTANSGATQNWVVKSTTYDSAVEEWDVDTAMTIPTNYSDVADADPADLQLGLVAGANGDRAAVSVNVADPASQVNLSVAISGEEWQATATPVSAVSATAINPGVAFDANGDAIVEWLGDRRLLKASRVVYGQDAGVIRDVDGSNSGYQAASPTSVSTEFGPLIFWRALVHDTETMIASNLLGLPNPVTEVVAATAASGELDVSWVAPTGSVKLTGYTVTTDPASDGCEAPALASGCWLTGLTDGTSYLITVIANGENGDSLGSSTIATPIAGTEPTSVAITSTVGANATVGSVYTSALTATGTGPIVYSISDGTLPDGIQLVGDTLTGIPTTAGLSTFTIEATDGITSDFEENATITVASAPATIALVLNFGAGSALAAATTTLSGSGLKPSSHWSLVLHSEPKTIAEGDADDTGSFGTVVKIPADTPAGSHSLELTGLNPAGGQVHFLAYFSVTADGKIGAISYTDAIPEDLAITGTDASAPLTAAALLLLIGAGLMAVRRHVTARRRLS